ncbi:MAG TPA: bifunctional nuclease family protein [Aggregatilineales bacterium]|jgi:bifunctional DNase/RNase|nr:bifunctional nuclease family protein [Aggregatilineales bacterium]
MIEVVIDSIRVSLMSQHRLVTLKDVTSDRLLPIWIGPFEAEAITVELQPDNPPSRPMTHDLLKAVIRELGGRVVHVYISDIKNDVFYARIVVEVNDRQIDIDSRTSDAIALAVRAKVPIFVNESVLTRGGIKPDEDVENDVTEGDSGSIISESEPIGEEKLSAFADFLNSLDLDLGETDDDK